MTDGQQFEVEFREGGQIVDTARFDSLEDVRQATQNWVGNQGQRLRQASHKRVEKEQYLTQ
jgi:hypothetical protein